MSYSRWIKNGMSFVEETIKNQITKTQFCLTLSLSLYLSLRSESQSEKEEEEKEESELQLSITEPIRAVGAPRSAGDRRIRRWIAEIRMTDPNLELQESGWEELRREARKIEGDLDVKLSSYAKLGARFTQGGSLFLLNFSVSSFFLFVLRCTWNLMNSGFEMWGFELESVGIEVAWLKGERGFFFFF